MGHFYSEGGDEARHLLVYLHGHGSSPTMVHPYFRQHHDDGWVRVCPSGAIATDGGWSWFGSGPRGVDRLDLEASVERVTTVVQSTVDELGLSWGDVVLGGFSQGAAVAIAVAASPVAAGSRGLLLQAGFVPEVFGAEVDLGAVRTGSILIQHGEADEVVPSYVAQDLASLLDRPGDRTVTLEVLRGGHPLSTPMLDGTIRWLKGLR